MEQNAIWGSGEKLESLVHCLVHLLPQCRVGRGFKTSAPTHNEEHRFVATHNPLVAHEFNLLDNLGFTETCALTFQDEPGDRDTEPSYPCDAELDAEFVGKALF